MPTDTNIDDTGQSIFFNHVLLVSGDGTMGATDLRRYRQRRRMDECINRAIRKRSPLVKLGLTGFGGNRRRQG
jgi:hypothetical protein